MASSFRNNDVAVDISILHSFEEHDIVQICTAACGYIVQGKECPIYSKTIGSFGKESKIESCIAGIASIYLQASDTDAVFNEIKEKCQLAESTLVVLKDCYQKHKKEIEGVQTCANGVEYRGLQWRLQTKVASRSQLLSYHPHVLLRLDLQNSGQPHSIALTSDIPNIHHWNEMIEEALAESRTQKARKIHRKLT